MTVHLVLINFFIPVPAPLHVFNPRDGHKTDMNYLSRSSVGHLSVCVCEVHEAWKAFARSGELHAIYMSSID